MVDLVYLVNLEVCRLKYFQQNSDFVRPTKPDLVWGAVEGVEEGVAMGAAKGAVEEAWCQPSPDWLIWSPGNHWAYRYQVR